MQHGIAQASPAPISLVALEPRAHAYVHTYLGTENKRRSVKCLPIRIRACPYGYPLSRPLYDLVYESEGKRMRRLRMPGYICTSGQIAVTMRSCITPAAPANPPGCTCDRQ